MSKAYGFLVFAIILVTGCTQVSASKPLGLPIWSRMHGVWYTDVEGTILLHIKLLPDGTLRVARSDWNSKTSQFDLERGKLVVSTNDDALYANIIFPSESGADKYDFFRLVQGLVSPEGIVILFPPKIDVFKEAIETGVLKGEIIKRKGEPDDISISDPEGFAKFVKAEKFNEQFDVESPIVLKRVANYSGPIRGESWEYLGKKDHTGCLPERFAESPGFEISGELSDSEYKSYRDCMSKNGYELIDKYSSKGFWITKNGLGLFMFEVKVPE